MRLPALAELFPESRRARGVTPATLAAYRIHLEQFTRARGKPTTLEIARLLADRRDLGASPGYVWTIARTLRAFARWAFAMGYLRRPVTVEMPRLPREIGRVLSEEETRRLLAVADPKERAAILLLLDTGLRRSEACSLLWSDLEGDAITLRRGKSGRPRIVCVALNTAGTRSSPRRGAVDPGRRTSWPAIPGPASRAQCGRSRGHLPQLPASVCDTDGPGGRPADTRRPDDGPR
jgi:integrase